MVNRYSKNQNILPSIFPARGPITSDSIGAPTYKTAASLEKIENTERRRAALSAFNQQGERPAAFGLGG